MIFVKIYIPGTLFMFLFCFLFFFINAQVKLNVHSEQAPTYTLLDFKRLPRPLIGHLCYTNVYAYIHTKKKV